MSLDFAAWLDEHGDYLFRYASRHFPERHVAEDLVQETFLAALEAASRFEGHSSPRTWLTAILRHKVIDRIRRAGREEPPRLEATESLDEYFDRSGHWKVELGRGPWQADPERSAMQGEFQTVIRGCVEKLPENHRQAFLLREVSELESEEVCRLLEISSANLRVILHRSRLSLQMCLEKNWFSRGTA